MARRPPRGPDLLTFTRELLVADAAADAGPAAYPSAWRRATSTLPLTYRFEPGAERDGVTVHVPLKVLPQLRDAGFDWLVPAFREELVTALIRSLPKDAAPPLVPVPEVAAEVLPERAEAAQRPLLDALARELEALRGVRDPRATGDLDRLPAHLRMTFRVEDERGARSPRARPRRAARARGPRLRAELGERARAARAPPA